MNRIAAPFPGFSASGLHFGAELRRRDTLRSAQFADRPSAHYAGIAKQQTGNHRSHPWQTRLQLRPMRENPTPPAPSNNATTHRVEAAPQETSKPAKYCFPSASDTFEYKSRGLLGSKKGQTTVQSLIGGGQIFQKVDEMLNKANSAKSWVLIDLYNMQSPALYPDRHSPKGTPGTDLQAGLVQKLVDLKQQKNVKVRVILDNSKQMVQPPFTLEPEHNARTLKFLRANGIETVTYPRDVSRINHPKVVLVGNPKNTYGMVTGMNWGNHSPTNHDGGVYMEGPDVRNIFHQVFKPDWITAGGDESKLPSISPFRQGKVQVLQTAGENSHQGAKDEILQSILSLIDKEQRSIHAELFVLTNKRVVDRLIDKHRQLRAAGQEGVKILVDPGLYFKFPNCRPGIQKMARAGVPIRFLECDRSKEEKLHAKWAVFGSQKAVLTGSANWSGVGLESKGSTEEYIPLVDEAEMDVQPVEGAEPRPIVKGNHEVNVLIENAPNVAGAFAKQAAYDFLNHSFPIMERGANGKWRPI